MKRITLTVFAIIFAFCATLLLLSTKAQAESCIGNWYGDQVTAADKSLYLQHKPLHLLGNAALTAGAAWATNNVWIGVAAGIGASAYREHWKLDHGFRCERSSMAYDAAGVLIGALGAQHWLIVPMPQGLQVTYATNF